MAAQPLLPPLVHSAESVAQLESMARERLAQISGQITVPHLKRPVEVFRDPWGVPHIYAETQDDLFFAQGFVAAQDRLWQLELWRRVGEGELAEILGPRAIARDRLARLLRYRGDMDAEFRSYARDGRQILEAFVRGINFYIAFARDRLPIEFQLAGVTPAPWGPETCVTRMAGFVMTRNLGSEIFRAQLIRELGPDLAEQLAPTDPPRRDSLIRAADLEGADRALAELISAVGTPIRFEATDGSNNWVVDANKSRTGKPILASDPHRAMTLPSLRYIVHLVGPGWNAIGSGEPALPGIALGHNERIGFGITIFGIDQQDLYVEETNPGNPDEYRWRGRWRKMRTERELINVKGAKPVEVELKFTLHGPVIYQDAKRHRAYALRWVGTEPGAAGYLAGLSVSRARNWQEFRRALQRWKIPSLNFVYADVDGNIGWQVAGLAPVRRGWSGLLPVPGSQGQYEWTGFLRLADHPSRFNPASHFLASANNNLIPPGYPRELGFQFAPPFRYERIAEVLSASGPFDIADFARLQHDELSLPARILINRLRRIPNDSIEESLRPYATLLTNWDCVVSKNSGAAALFEIWWSKLGPELFKRHVPEPIWPRVAGRLPPEKVLELLEKPDPRWFGTPPEQGRDAALLRALSAAVSDAANKLGRDVSQWRWGKLHTATFVHPLATNPARSEFFNRGPVERGGDSFTVNMTGGADFKQTSGASYRHILDLANWDRSLAASVPGQSGQPGSPHYDNLLPLWAQGEYFPLLYSRERIEAVSTNRLVLTPTR